MERSGLVVQGLKEENDSAGEGRVIMSPTAVYECMGQFHILYLDNRQHSFVIVGVGLDLKALCGISVNYRVGSSPRPRVWVISVVYCQVDYHTRRALVHICLKLLEERETNHH